MMHCLKWWRILHICYVLLSALFRTILITKLQKPKENVKWKSFFHKIIPALFLAGIHTYIISSPCCYTLSANNCICPTLTALHSKSVWFGNICSKPNNRHYYCMESSSKLWPSCWQLWTGKYLLNPIDQLEVTYDRWSFFKCFFFCNVSSSYSS